MVGPTAYWERIASIGRTICGCVPPPVLDEAHRKAVEEKLVVEEAGFAAEKEVQTVSQRHLPRRLSKPSGDSAFLKRFPEGSEKCIVPPYFSSLDILITVPVGAPSVADGFGCSSSSGFKLIFSAARSIRSSNMGISATSTKARTPFYFRYCPPHKMPSLSCAVRHQVS